jgi:hypothetical protein
MLDVGHVLYGSQNYGLDGPDSDKDYKVFLCPEAEDFYHYKRVEKNDVPEGLDKEHYSPMDVRAFDRSLQVGNPNCLEMLWSRKTEELFIDFDSYMSLAQDLFKQGYLVMVFPQFLSAVKGTIFNSFKRYGVNRKSASRATFWMNFVLKLMSNDFKVADSFWQDEPARKMRFDEKVYLPALEDFEKMFASLERQALCHAEEVYHNLNSTQVRTYRTMAKELQKRMEQFVFGNLVEELVSNGY